MITNNFNYLYTKKVNLNLSEIKDSSNLMYDVIHKNFVNQQSHHDGQRMMTTKLYTQYNVLMYPFPEFHELYEEIKNTFYEVSEGQRLDQKYYIQSWLNVYRKGEFIDWHPHWHAYYNVWHGFYCVDVEPNSSTTYRIPINGKEEEVVVKSENNLLVMGKSENDEHRSSEWLIEEYPRITIAFDIVPRTSIDATQNLNHWIPI
jgi:hypothetical protein